jgi:hypothetical protein
MTRAFAVVRTHWYAPLFLAMLAAVWLLARNAAFMASGGEAALLIDLCVTAPVLYALCYGKRQPVRQTAIKAIAIACAGVWLASWLIPAASQSILPHLTPIRWAGLVVIALVEVRLVIAAVRLAFSRSATAQDIAKASDAPQWIARLMLAEARLWRSLWNFIRGRGWRP